MAILSPSLKQLADEVAPGFPRKGTSDGWIGDPDHQNRKSDHNPDDRGIVHAIDIDKDGTTIPMELVLAVVVADTRTEYVIWRGKIYSRFAGFAPRTYGGTNPHDEHMHVSGRYGETYENDTHPWFDFDQPEEEEEVLKAVLVSTGTRLDVFYVDSENRIRQRYSNDFGGTWHPTITEPGLEIRPEGRAKALISAARKENDYIVVVVGMTDRLHETHWVSSEEYWTTWRDIGGSLV